MSDIQFPNALLGPGNFFAEVQDNNGSPTEVLEAGRPIRVQTHWRISPLAALLLGGQWTVTVYVESIGPGPEQRVGSETRAVNGGQNYDALVTVPPNTLPNDPPQTTSGVYKVVTVLTHRNFGRPSNVAAVVEGPVIRIA
jgi:hypothetical protein